MPFKMSSRRIYETSDWEETVKPASRGIRVAMVLLDVFLLLNGLVLIVLGIHLNHYVTSTSSSKQLPPIWALGILPIILGTVGIVCILLRARKWVVLWLLLCVILGVASFLFFAMFRFLDPSVYGINIHVFGDCEQDGTNCKCLWDQNKSVVGLLRSPCDHVRTTSILFLGLVLVFIVCTACTVICAILGCVLTFCLRLCASKNERTHELHTRIYGADSRPSNGYIQQAGPLYRARYTRVSHQELHAGNVEIEQLNTNRINGVDTPHIESGSSSDNQQLDLIKPDEVEVVTSCIESQSCGEGRSRDEVTVLRDFETVHDGTHTQSQHMILCKT